MITKRDKQIIKFAEKYGSITINQCATVFFNGNKEAYDQARKRLRIIYDEGLLKRYRKDPRSEAVYFIDKALKVHDLKLMDVFCKLYKFEMPVFQKESKFIIDDETTYIVDAAISINIDNRMLPLVVEIDYTHYTGMGKIKTLVADLESGHDIPFVFIIVKLAQQDLEIINIGVKSKLYILPWNLDKLDSVVIPLLIKLALCSGAAIKS